MRISELIDKLRNELEIHGDLKVYLDNDCDGYLESEICDIYFNAVMRAENEDPDRRGGGIIIQ